MEVSFDDIFKASGLSQLPDYLWRLKVTDEQYLGLREYLVSRWKYFGSFNSCPREAALYMAEWWKRDPDTDEESGIENRLFLSLGVGRDEEGKKNFIGNARRVMDPRDRAYLGFKPLVITHRRSNTGERNRQRTTYYDYTLFYQGGFPMGKALSGRKSNKWSQCIPKFVRSNFSLGDVPGSLIASRLLEDYKEVLVSAAREKRPGKMPFACESESHPWYQFALKGIDAGISEMEGRPFRITWVLDKEKGGMGSISCCVHGSAELRESFLKYHKEVQLLDNITIQLFEDDKFIQNIAEYSAFISKEGRGFMSFAETSYKFKYDGHSKISIRIAETGETVCSSSYDSNIPHVFFWDGLSFTMGSRFGTRRSLILFRHPWTVMEMPDGAFTTSITIDGTQYGLIDSRPEDDGSFFLLRNNDTGDTYEAGSDAGVQEWTEVEIHPFKMSKLIYGKAGDFSNPEAFRVFRCKSDDDKEDVDTGMYLFRSASVGEWRADPPLGVISCAVLDKPLNRGGKVSSLPENDLINLGPGFSIERRKFYPAETHYQISWDGGDVFIDSPNVRRDGNLWVCGKMEFPEFIPLHFIPTKGRGEPFDLKIRATYRETTIYSSDGRKVESGEIIPLSLLSEYRYHLTAIENFPLRCDGDSVTISVSNDSLGQDSQTIPEEGPLALPLSSFLSQGRNDLDKGCVIDFRTVQFIVMDYPLSLVYHDEKKAFSLALRNPYTRSDENWNQNQEKIATEFKGHLVMSSLLDGRTTDLFRNVDGLYLIPDGLKGDFAVAASVRGHVKPFIFNTEGGEVSPIDHIAEKESLLATGLNTGCWKAAAQFMELGLRYSLNMSNLPWIGTIINDSVLLSLYIFQGLAQDPTNIAAEDVLRARIRMALRDATTPYKGIENVMSFMSLVQGLACQDNFKQSFDYWKFLGGVSEGEELYLQYLGDTLNREFDFTESIINH